jgi:hypothetical protein
MKRTLWDVYLRQGSLTEARRLSKVDLLVLPNLDKFLFILKIFFTSVRKQATLMRRSTVLSLPLQSVPCLIIFAKTGSDCYIDLKCTNC